MGGSGSGNQKTTTEPWRGQRPYLRQGFEEAQNIFDQGPQEFFPGSTIAGPGQTTQSAWDLITNRALTGNPAQQAATINATNTAMGGFLGANPGQQLYQNVAGSFNPAMIPAAQFGLGATQPQQTLAQMGQGMGNVGLDLLTSTAMSGSANPFLDDMFNRAAGRVEDRFRTITAPQTDSAARAAGIFGGSDYQRMRGMNEQALAGELGGLATDIYGSDFARSQAQQLQAQQALAGLTQGQQGLQQSALQQAIGSQMQGLGMFGNMFQNQLANQLAAGGAMDSAFQAERGQMADASRTALGLAAQDYVDLDRLAGVGTQQDALSQAQLQEQIDRFMWQQQADAANLAQYMNFIQGNYGGTVTSPGAGGANQWQGALGGAASGAALGTSIMPGWGTAIGAAGGGLLGAFA